MPIKIILLSLKKISLKEENFFLLRIKIEEKTKSKPTKSLKSKKYLNLRAKTKKIIKNGKQNKLYSFINLLSLTFDLENCRKLIVIDTGIKMLMVLGKSYPIIKNDGVPNNNRPTPKMDCITIRNTMMLISNNESI